LLNRQQEELLEREIARISEDLESASDLVFHTVFLTDDIQGASVMVDGRDGVDDTLFLTYYETTKWVTLDEMEDR
jgi:hypothetical protein